MEFSTELPYTVDCGFVVQHPELLSRETVIRSEMRQNDDGKIVNWALSHITPGYEIAGSAMRRQDCEVWRVSTCDAITGTRYGARYKTLAEAEAWLSQRGTLIT